MSRRGTSSPRGSIALVPAVQQMGIPILFGGIVILDREKQEAMNASVLMSPRRQGGGHLREDAPRAVCGDHSLLRVRGGASILPQRRRHLESLGQRHPLHDLQVPLRAGGELSFGTSHLFRGCLCRPVQGLYHPGRRPAGEHHQRFLVEDVVVGDPAFFRGAVSGNREPPGAGPLDKRRACRRWSGPGARSGSRMPFFESTWRTVDVPVYREKTITPYTRFGDWFPLAPGGTASRRARRGRVAEKKGCPRRSFSSTDSLSGLTKQRLPVVVAAAFAAPWAWRSSPSGCAHRRRSRSGP